MAAIFALAAAFAVSGQGAKTPPPPRPGSSVPAVPPYRPMPVDTTEKSIAVDGSVSISLCVTQGRLKVNGWNRSEVRVYVERGSKIAFNIRDKAVQSGQPNWIAIISTDPRPRGECLVAEQIEIDVPIRAKVSVKGTEVRVSIDSVREAEVSTVGGEISIRNIAGRVSALNRQGGITVESSMGAMSLESTSGNIVVFDVGPGEIGDHFRAKTHGGTISLQTLQHRQVEVGTITGTVVYNGPLRSGGSYNINTNKGAIRLALPANTSALIQATYSSGNFVSELPLKLEMENISEGPIKSIVGRIGTGGDAFVKLTTNNGSISIKKQ